MVAIKFVISDLGDVSNVVTQIVRILTTTLEIVMADLILLIIALLIILNLQECQGNIWVSI